MQHKTKMRRLGAIAICVFAFVIMRLNRIVEKSLGVLNIVRNLWQISQFQRCSVGLNNIHEVDTIEKQFIVFNMKFFGRKIKSLLNKICVSVHLPGLCSN
jgi:hypothetical protein